MSEYQYYEFLALDRSLSQDKMAHLRGFSSRAQITPHSFVNEYNWGSFKGNPDQWMERYFDAFIYFANWGSRRFMLRLPTKLLDRKTVESYCDGESLSCWQKDDHTILSFAAELEDFEPDDESISLASLLSIRADLMRGDYCALYLGWLLAVQCQEVKEQEIEPPVPSGLGHRHGSLDCLAAFLAIDPDLIAAAAESSADEQLPVLSKTQIGEWVRSLPSADKDAIVTRLIDGDDPHIAAEVRQRAICEIAGKGGSRERQRRTAAEILARGETIAAERKKRDAKERAKEQARRERAEAEARKKRLESLAGKEHHLWSTVDKLIATKQPRRYDEAVSILKDLHDLAVLKGNSGEFKSRMAALERTNAAKGTLIERFGKANLLARGSELEKPLDC